MIWFFPIIFSLVVIGRLCAEPEGAELLAPGLQPRVDGISARLTEHADPARGPVWSVEVSRPAATDWSVRLVATNAVALARGDRAVVELDLRRASQHENVRWPMVDGRMPCAGSESPWVHHPF